MRAKQLRETRVQRVSLRAILALVKLLFVTLATAQNLLPNGDFESYTQCPDYVSQIDRATGWSRPTDGTSDYFNACVGVPFSENVPDNEFGYEPAHSGNGYAGFYCFYSTTPITTAPDNDHEYVTHALGAPLIPGASYSVEFFVSLADVSKYAVNDIGALLSVQPPTRADEFAITATPQIMNTSLAMLDSKNGWTRIAGCFVADSAFAYITIGNFHVGAATVFAQVPTNNPQTYYSYYYVDDASVTPLVTPQLGPDTVICARVDLAVMDPIDGVTYSWSTGEEGVAISVGTSGVYSVSANSNGCVVADTVVVFSAPELPLALPADTLVDFCIATSLMVEAQGLPPNAAVLWNTGATSLALTVEVPGSYSVTATAAGFCPASAAMEVINVCNVPLHIPNAFSPNGDGINDVWLPVWLANPDAHIYLRVYDRWGHEQFATSVLGEGWDGIANGDALPSGVYAWSCSLKDHAARIDRVLRGHLTLVR